MGQETLLNLLLRNYLHYNLFDQVCHPARTPAHAPAYMHACILMHAPGMPASRAWCLRRIPLHAGSIVVQAPLLQRAAAVVMGRL